MPISFNNRKADTRFQYILEQKKWKILLIIINMNILRKICHDFQSIVSNLVNGLNKNEKNKINPFNILDLKSICWLLHTNFDDSKLDFRSCVMLLKEKYIHI